jgi:putative ATP-binding cassette transporter
MRNLVPSSTFARGALGLVHPYWTRSGERGAAWALLIAILALTLGLVWLNVQYNFWNRNFFNALEAKDTRAFWHLIPDFFGLSVLTVVGGALQSWLTQRLQMRWRLWLTGEHLDGWLSGQRYYLLEQDSKGTDNPDQRIAEDLKLLATSTLELSLGLLHNAVTLVTFIAILWSVSGPLLVPFTSGTWSIPGDMVWAALGYAIVGSAATYYVGRPLIGLRFQQERLEADMRYGLMRTREHAEGIALYGGEVAERRQIDGRIERLYANWRQIMAASFKLNTLSGTYTQIGILFPYFLTSPRYFSGTMPLGVLTQIAGAFDTVRVALSWFVFNYQALASWKASVDRLLTFQAALAGPEPSASQDASIARSETGDDRLETTALTLTLPDRRLLLSGADLRIERGERLMLSGVSGSGKSTLFRALAGLWHCGSGTIRMPRSRTLFLPQRPYLPIGTLAQAIAYPSQPGMFTEQRIEEALRGAGLDSVRGRLHEIANWGQVLSGGEQQKLAIARALLNAPDWLFLDEATASLDEDSERAAYAALLKGLPTASIVSISHRASLARFHHHAMTIAEGRLRPI